MAHHWQYPGTGQPVQCEPEAPCRSPPPQLEPVSLGTDFHPKGHESLLGTLVGKTLALFTLLPRPPWPRPAFLWLLPCPPQHPASTCSCCLVTFKQGKRLNSCCPRGPGLLAASQACPGKRKQLVLFPDLHTRLFSGPQAQRSF